MQHCNIMIMDTKVNFKTEFVYCNAIVNLILSVVHHS